MLTLEDILTSSGLYPDRKESRECTYEVIANAQVTLARVNALIAHLGILTSVTSGFRTKAANSAAKGAKNSAHMIGKAVDLFDPQGKIDRMITDEILEKFDLYREDPDRTPGWVHLDTVVRKNRTFKV